MRLSILLLLLLSTSAFAAMHTTYEVDPIFTAKEVREQVVENLREQNGEENSAWVRSINQAIRNTIEDGGAQMTIEITKASAITQAYLSAAYEQAGYRVEVIPGWNKNSLIPDGRTYLGLSW